MQTKIPSLATGEAGRIYLSLIRDLPVNAPPSRFAAGVLSAWRRLLPTLRPGKKQQISGKVFEFMIADVLAHHGILPFYWQVEFSLVPNATFDFILYRPKSPVVLAAKTSLRERYKQADLEGMAVRQVYRRAESYLITASPDEAAGVERKIAAGDITGIDRCVLAETGEFDTLIEELRKKEFSKAAPINPIRGGRTLIE